MKTQTKMYTKSILVSFLAIATALFLVAGVSAADVGAIDSVKVDGTEIHDSSTIVSVVTDESISVRVEFISDVNASDITIEAEIEGDKKDVKAETAPFDVESGKSYKKTLTLKVPYELKDKLSADMTLNLEISGDGYKTTDSYTFRVQRTSYITDIKSVTVSQTVEAGEIFPVDIVLKNTGYNDLDDLYVKVSMSALGVEKTSYFGDIVALECDDDKTAEENYGVDIDRDCDEDDTDTITGRLYLKVPYDTKAGIYTLEVEVANDDTTSNVVKQIAVENDFSSNVIVASSSKTAAVGESATYSLLLVNPTDKLKVYRIVVDSSAELTTGVSEAVVAVAAGSSKTIEITASGTNEGEYSFSVNVLSGEELVSAVGLKLNVEGSVATKSLKSPVVVLTIVLAIIFIVLLIALIALIGKKPEKSEEFGESYY